MCLMREEEDDCEGNRAGGREERSELLSSLHLDFKGDIDAALIPSAPPVCGGRGGGGGREGAQTGGGGGGCCIHILILNVCLYCFVSLCNLSFAEQV